jgi:hypothetical protein
LFQAIEVLKLVVITSPPIAALIILSVLMITQVQTSLQQTNAMSQFVGDSKLVNSLVFALQNERTITCLLLER